MNKVIRLFSFKSLFLLRFNNKEIRFLNSQIDNNIQKKMCIIVSLIEGEQIIDYYLINIIPVQYYFHYSSNITPRRGILLQSPEGRLRDVFIVII
jgi:hypothetical protein